jgi:hypothetical protein
MVLNSVFEYFAFLPRPGPHTGSSLQFPMAFAIPYFSNSTIVEQAMDPCMDVLIMSSWREYRGADKQHVL